MNIEFTDRYGGNPPSWLRGCFECEAMGVVPVEDNREPDGWRFYTCRRCHGTGRVNWLVSILRIPRWIWKGLDFILTAGLNWEMKAERMTRWQHFVLYLKIAFLADLGLWRP